MNWSLHDTHRGPLEDHALNNTMEKLVYAWHSSTKSWHVTASVSPAAPTTASTRCPPLRWIPSVVTWEVAMGMELCSSRSFLRELPPCTARTMTKYTPWRRRCTVVSPHTVQKSSLCNCCLPHFISMSLCPVACQEAQLAPPGSFTNMRLLFSSWTGESLVTRKRSPWASSISCIRKAVPREFRPSQPVLQKLLATSKPFALTCNDFSPLASCKSCTTRIYGPPSSMTRSWPSIFRLHKLPCTPRHLQLLSYAAPRQAPHRKLSFRRTRDKLAQLSSSTTGASLCTDRSVPACKANRCTI
mmetsp:Transcript_6087/g.16519  ORF Transcript_6087/g.16519 Transcript_6087/m.16519 type:complete len:300 (+) Transcript_6087:54-953(+)